MPDPKADVNFYELFGIDPSESLNAAEVRQRIKDAVDTWNKQSGQPGKGEVARRNREAWGQWKGRWNVADISAISDQDLQKLLEPDRKARQQTLEQDREAKQTQLAEEVEFAGLKGDILQREIDAWEAAYSDVATRTEIEQLARPHMVKDRDESQLSQNKLDRIDESLRSIGEESLFSLLKLSSGASDAEVVDKAKQLYSDVFRRKSEEWTTKKDLSGEAKDLFAHPALAQQYRDHARQQRFYRAYLEPVKACCDASHEIMSPQVDHLLARAEKDGWNHNEAVETLFSAAWQHGWRVFPPTVTGRGSSSEELRRQLDAYTAERRRYEEQHRIDQQRITDAEWQAKVAKKERDKLDQQYREDKKRFDEERANSQAEREQLERKLRDAERRGAQRAAEAAGLQRNLEALKQCDEASIQRHIAEVAPLLASQMARAELVAARGIIKEFSVLPPQWSGDAQRIERGIAEARRLLAEAQRAERGSRMSEAESLVDQALAICSDLPQAQSFKARLPPEAPTRLEARVDSGSVALTWMPSPSRDVRYVIVRSDGRAPLTLGDGRRLAHIKECAWRDEGVPPARRLWYAVFAERGSTLSAGAAITSAAVLLAPDALDVRAESGDASVTLRWRLPRDAHSIRVVRNETHAPRTPDDGQVFTLGETTLFNDTQLVNGRRYYYRVYCEYTDPDGDTLRSEGVTEAAVPTPALTAVPELTLRVAQGITNYTVYPDALSPAQGTLAVYRTTSAPALSAGTKVPAEQHKALLGADCHAVTGQRDILTKAGEYFYTPVVLFQQMAYIGAPRSYRYCPPVRQLKARDIPGPGIELRWTLPLGCDGAEVRYVAEGSSAATPIIALVPRVTSADVVYVARGLPRGVYKIDVLARYQFAGQVVYSTEESRQMAHTAPVRVRYALQAERGFMGRVHSVLVMSADEPVVLPGIQVTYGRDPITSPADGRLLVAVAGLPHPSTTWTIPLAEFTPEPGARVYVFPDQMAQASELIFDYAPAMPQV